MLSIARAEGASVPNRIDGFQVPQIVSDSVTVEFASLLDRLGVTTTTTGFFANANCANFSFGCVGWRARNWKAKFKTGNARKTRQCHQV